MDRCREAFEKTFKDHFQPDDAAYLVWTKAWIASREQALKDCRERIRKLRDDCND